MKILDKLKIKIKAIAAKIAGCPQSPTFATIYIIKNNEKIKSFSSQDPDSSNMICDIIYFFHKYNDYKIIYNYVDKEIYIYFTVKKSNEIECTDSLNKK